MASFFKALIRLAVKRRQPQTHVRPDEEQGQGTVADSFAGSSTLPPSNFHITGHGVARNDALEHFRVMLGITTAPHLGFGESASRPAANNLGLYARVVHSEQTAKDSYKVFSIVINGCYFLQIIVAAALTALGAANADNKAITAFGAINTVIAGFLTYLKGSGYPARFKYCASEWKKIREFIEHRERAFSLEGCDLDVYEVVDTVREMYDATKREIEMSTPDGYNARTASSTRYDAGVDTAKAEAIAGKLRGLDDTARKLRTRMGSGHSVAGGVEFKSEDAVHTLRTHMGPVSEGIEAKSDDVVAKLRSLEDKFEKVKTFVEKTVHDGRDSAHNAAQNTAHAIDDGEKRVMGELRNLGKTVIKGAEEHKPHVPHEFSVTVSHHDGGRG